MAQNPFKLDVYNDAFKLSKDIYNEIRKNESKGHSYRVKEQLRASVSSICANLAEMGAFNNNNQVRQKIKVCIGEANETEHWLTFSKEVGLLDEKITKQYKNEIKMIRMKLFNLLKSIPPNPNKK